MDFDSENPSRERPLLVLIPEFLRTQGFELFNNDDVVLAVKDVNECVDACGASYANGRSIDCKSFDFSEGHCSLTKEAAVPLGNGQLKQKTNSEYYEKICVDGQISRNCPPVFNRFPQMILVGFAESVTDAPSFEQCFHNCLNSYQLYGFNCTSGMYYFEEAQLNCILNSESRHTQSELFAEENTDIVDYFEIGCDRKEQTKTRVQKTRARGVKTQTLDTTKLSSKSENLVIAEETSTEWSECDDGVQHRRRDCADRHRPCGLESRACGEKSVQNGESTEKSDGGKSVERAEKAEKSDVRRKPPSGIYWNSSPPVITTTRRTSTTTTTTTTTTTDISTKDRKKAKISMDRLKSALKSFSCARDVCCPVFGGCEVGLMQNSETRKLEWCHNPC